VHVVEIVEMDDEELYVPDDVLEETNSARYQMRTKKIKITLLCSKNWKNFGVYENQ
jgi:hypothetical protein